MTINAQLDWTVFHSEVVYSLRGMRWHNVRFVAEQQCLLFLRSIPNVIPKDLFINSSFSLLFVIILGIKVHL